MQKQCSIVPCALGLSALVGGFLLVSALAPQVELQAGFPDSVRQAFGREQEQEKPLTDLHGDPLPPGAIARMGTVRLRHLGPPQVVAFSADGKFLASAERDVVVWDIVTGKEARRFRERGSDSQGVPLSQSPGDVRSLSFSADGRYLAAWFGNSRPPKGGGHIHVWDLTTGELLSPFGERSHRGGSFVGFSADSKSLIAGGGNTIWVWEVTTHREVGRLESLHPLHGLTLSQDGKTIAAIKADPDEGTAVWLWDANCLGKALWRLESPGLTSGKLAFSPDGQTFAASAGGMVQFWDVGTGKTLHRFAVRPPDGEPALDPFIRFTPDGKLLAQWGGAAEVVSFRDVDTGKEVRQFRERHVYGSSSLAFSPSGKSMALGTTHSQTVRLRDTTTGRRVLDVPGHRTKVLAVAFAQGSRALASADAGTVCLWGTQNGKVLSQVETNFSYAHRIAFSPDGTTCVTAGARSKGPDLLCGWDLTGEGSLRWSLRRSFRVNTLAFVPGGKSFVSGGDGIVRLLDAATGQEIRLFRHETEVSAVAVSPEGKTLAAAGETGVVRFWELTTGKQVRDLLAHPQQGPVDCLAFSPDGRTLYSAGRNYPIRMWEVDTGKELRRVALPGPERTFGLAVSPDGKSLAWADGVKTVSLCEVITGKERRHFGGGALCLAFAPDGKSLAAGGGDSTVLVWDLVGRTHPSSDRPGRLEPHEPETCWTQLADDDGATAYQAMCILFSAGDRAEALLKRRLRPVPSVDQHALRRLVNALDDDAFAIREEASQQLKSLGDSAVPMLREALRGRISPEARRRVKALLATLQGPVPPDRLRILRAIEVLERLGTTPARQILESLSDGDEGALETREARAAMQRLGGR